MEEKILTNKKEKPTDSILESTLGETYQYFKTLNKITNHLSQEWYFTSPKSGWTFKVYDSKKILFWIFPYKNMFRVAFALREPEKEELLAHDISNRVNDLISSSKKYSEGYAVRIDIFSKKDFQEIEKFVKFLMKIRSN